MSAEDGTPAKRQGELVGFGEECFGRAFLAPEARDERLGDPSPGDPQWLAGLHGQTMSLLRDRTRIPKVTELGGDPGLIGQCLRQEREPAFPSQAVDRGRIEPGCRRPVARGRGGDRQEPLGSGIEAGAGSPGCHPLDHVPSELEWGGHHERHQQSRIVALLRHRLRERHDLVP